MFADDSKVMRECNDTTAAVAAHCAFPAVRVKINHLEIIPGAILQQDQSIGTDPEMAVAKPGDLSGIGAGEPLLVALVDHDKIVAGALVFPELHFWLIK